MDTRGEREQGGTTWETRIDILILTLPCTEQIASGNLVDSTWSSARCSVMTQRSERVGGRRSKRAGIHAHIQLIHSVVQH